VAAGALLGAASAALAYAVIVRGFGF
jgi:hypothetical protein